MQSFCLPLPGGCQIDGRMFISKKQQAGSVPMLICIHGGSYDAEYFDADDHHSVATLCEAFEIPVISLSRPGYGLSSPLPKVAVSEEGYTYAQWQGKYLNDTVIPAIWSAYGKPAGATTVVILAHSIGAMMATVAAGCYTGKEGYPLGGLITSGIGSKLNSTHQQNAVSLLSSKPKTVLFPPAMKDALMLQLPSRDVTDPAMTSLTERLNRPMPAEEFHDINLTWLEYWQQYSGEVKIPLLYGLSEFDELWVSSDNTLKEYCAAFSSSPKVQSWLVQRAPHCIELSYQGKAWLSECCEFAQKCAKWYKSGIVP